MSDISLSKAVRSNLLSLQNTATMMAKTQDRLASGNKVNSALDNPSSFFTASALNSRAGDLNALIDGMANGVKTLEAADNGLSSITKTLESMQSTLRQARQDKSFQVDTFEVAAGSTLQVNGGQFGELTEIKLQEATGGTKASVSFDAAYGDATPDATKHQGEGARTLIGFDDAGFSATSKLRIDGQEIELTGLAGSPVAGDVADAIEANLGNLALAGHDDQKYTVSTTADGRISIENLDKTAASPSVEFVTGVTAATYGETSFVYNASAIGEVSVGGQNISTGGGTFDAFVASLQENAEDGGYIVNADATTKRISLVSTTPGGNAPVIEGIRQNAAAIPATAATTTFELDVTLAQNLTIAGVTAPIVIGAGVNDAAVLGAFTGNTEFNDAYTISGTIAGGFTIEARTAGTATAPGVSSSVGAQLDAVVPTDGTAGTAAITDGVDMTTTDGTDGSFTTEVKAAAHEITLTYGNKSADISIVGQDSTSATPKADQLKLINDQLKAAGLSDIEASFDADDKLVFTALTEEAKTLAVSGKSNGLFGTETVSTGTPAVSAYKATNAVDQFVEEINRNAATNGSLRASNDNGKLRIENLSTQELSVEFDKDGAGAAAATNHTIGGNTVRENLAQQFNELKDQLNKLADDASFNGINLLRGDQLTITFNETGNSFMQIKAGDDRGVNSQSLNISDLSAIELDSDANIDALLGTIKTSLNSVRSQASAFGSNLSIVQNRQDFTKNMINTLQTGAANLTLADMNEEAANLLALQTRQSLSSSALSMASQADQSVLQLLR